MSSTIRLTAALAALILTFSQVSQALPNEPQQTEVRSGENHEVEQEVNLGFGFRAVMMLIDTPSEVGHFSFLYYGDQRISRMGTCSVSPSGNYVVFQDSSAHVVVYRRADGKRTQLTIRPVPSVMDFVWHEDAGTVDWHYGTESRSFREAMEKPLPVQTP